MEFSREDRNVARFAAESNARDLARRGTERRVGAQLDNGRGAGYACGAMKLPIGIQTFRKIREKGHVDKTAYARRLAEGGGHYFLSRPRRRACSWTR